MAVVSRLLPGCRMAVPSTIDTDVACLLTRRICFSDCACLEYMMASCTASSSLCIGTANFTELYTGKSDH